jgi:UDP-N-acetylmuramoyl-tripeptide--D-alanyl-D-alanine ligase
MIAQDQAKRTLFEAGEVGGMIGGACKGNLRALVDNVQLDSRLCTHGSLFVALRGERADGHDFIVSALNKGASCILADAKRAQSVLASLNPDSLANACIVFVETPLQAFQRLAKEHRRRIKGLVKIAVTGSSGKTTTKECIGAALTAACPSGIVAVGAGNLNSDSGLPLALFSLQANHEIAVFEMGMNRRGEMDELAELYEPDIGVITNIGTAHIGLIGSRQAIAEEKKKIFSRFDGSQKGYVWDSDDFKSFLMAGVKGKVGEFGFTSTKGFKGAENLGLLGWRISWMDESFVFPLPGRHNLMDALAALSVVGDMNLQPKLLCDGLSRVKPLFGRSEVFFGKISLYRDCYNANPDSSRAVLDLCDSIEWPGRKIYVLGSMRELGELSLSEHVGLGERAASSDASALFFFGEEAEASYTAAMHAFDLRSTGMKRIPLYHTNDIGLLIANVISALRLGDLVAVKASRGLELERLTEAMFESGWADRTKTSSEGVVNAS